MVCFTPGICRSLVREEKRRHGGREERNERSGIRWTELCGNAKSGFQTKFTKNKS